MTLIHLGIHLFQMKAKQWNRRCNAYFMLTTILITIIVRLFRITWFIEPVHFCSQCFVYLYRRNLRRVETFLIFFVGFLLFLSWFISVFVLISFISIFVSSICSFYEGMQTHEANVAWTWGTFSSFLSLFSVVLSIIFKII